MEKKNCAKCSQSITGIDFIACRGYCGGMFHMSCSGVTRALMSYFTSHKKNLYWMCDKCAELFENSHLRSITSHSDVKSPLSSLSDAIANLQTEIKKMTAISVATIQSPNINNWPRVNESTRAAKRPREQSLVRISPECQSGSKQLNQNVVSVAVSAKPVNKFWLYLSRIRSDVTNEAISEMVKANLGQDTDPVVVKLVTKGSDTSNMSFISFKVGLDPALKDGALDPSTWPEGVMFREFVDYNSQKFRKLTTTSPAPSPASVAKN